ncbi:hypothetical protein RvY_12372 [Ramazzottius varieornatus]|uniref:Uncharacterized protein n=1 Tax=Ramazzottius varieornatus TaxID=947166 RepID=A0A1D1VRY0_RAMVA|nr:hypothetical protein RvY_12372 [Ramazzottius varieornatus]
MEPAAAARGTLSETTGAKEAFNGGPLIKPSIAASNTPTVAVLASDRDDSASIVNQTWPAHATLLSGNGAEGQMTSGPSHLLRPHPHVAYLYQAPLPAANNIAPSQHLSFQRKCLLAASSSTVIGLILMLVAVCTDYWLIVINPGGTYLSHDKLWRMASHSGVWRICNIDFRNETHPFRIDTQCQRHILFPSDVESDQMKHDFDQNSLNYTRSEVAFSTLALILMVVGQCLAFYSLDEDSPFLWYRRVTALLHLTSATCVLVCIEVLVSSVSYEQAHLPFRHPAASVSHFGFSFVLACVACAAFYVAGLVFAFFSRKRRPKKMPSSNGEDPAASLTEMAALDHS